MIVRIFLLIASCSVVLTKKAQVPDRNPEILQAGYSNWNDPRDCKPHYGQCEFWLDVEEKLTMMYYKTQVYPYDGKLFPYDEKNPANSSREVDREEVITTDGYLPSKRVFVVNGTMPGPAIEVYTGQKVVIHVKNSLRAEAMTLHWHGLHQRGTPWMDGVGYVSQCPIGPGQTFTYSFTINQGPGTHWYHAHVGAQRTMGIYGAFIIRERFHPRPIDLIEDKTVIISDWNNEWDSYSAHLRMVYGMFIGNEKYHGTSSIEGGYYSLMRFTSGLVNGRGRIYMDETITNGAPLEVFTVTPGAYVKFRLINAGTLYPFRVSIDGHMLIVIASDGSDLQQFQVQSLIINPGERYDVMIMADQKRENYWMRLHTLEVEIEHFTRAIVRYKGAPEREPETQQHKCTKTKRCRVFNCPFSIFPKEWYIDCLNFNDVKRLGMGKATEATPFQKGNSKEYFYNFAFPGYDYTPGSVNGKTYLQPVVSAVSQLDEVEHLCRDDKNCGEDKVCHCTFMEKLKLGQTVQMTFLNLGKGRGWAHPIHLHGHHFEVLKVGFPSCNHTTAKIDHDNFDIECGGNRNREESFCNAAKWSNKLWSGDSIPGLNLVNPPLKDTVMVPTGGYVVVRFKADNPGVWIMHCHIEIHNLDGMTMLFAEGEEKIPKAPKGFPKCGNF